MPDPRAPNTLLLGAAKCGTTWLHRTLAGDPRIFMTRVKEPHFFDADAYYARGLRTYLRHHFRGAADFPVRGESTPQYFHLGRKVAPRVARDLGPEQRFIVVLRDPAERAWSHYLHAVRFGAERASFLDAIARPAGTGEMDWTEYVQDGLYARQLEPWLDAYPPDRFLFLLTEELASDADRLAWRLGGFLGLAGPVSGISAPGSNPAARARSPRLARALHVPTRLTRVLKRVAPYRVRIGVRRWIDGWNQVPHDVRPSLDPASRERLVDRFRPDVERLQKLIGRDLSDWLVA